MNFEKISVAKFAKSFFISLIFSLFCSNLFGQFINFDLSASKSKILPTQQDLLNFCKPSTMKKWWDLFPQKNMLKPINSCYIVSIGISQNKTETVAIPLLKKLEAGKAYTLSCQIANPDTLFSKICPIFCIAFSDKNDEGIYEKWQKYYDNPSKQCIKTDKKYIHKWVPYRVNFTATGDEDYLVLFLEKFKYKLDSVENDDIAKRNFKNSNAHIFVTDIKIDDFSINNTLPEASTFDYGKSLLKPEAFTTLDEWVRRLNDTPATQIKITGYTDNQGSEELNLKLSKARALAVGQYLNSKGIERKRISLEGLGNQNPIESNDSEQGRAKNRRVEIEIVNP
jgi:outer membrane protein OmpA-like peptidoglycan-associated protein